MELRFEKWHGCLNDFIVFHIYPDESLLKAIINKAPILCNRNGNGIGADGLLIISQKDPKDFHDTMLTIINSDGSLAKTCGNGIRCAARSLLASHLKVKNEAFDAIPLTLNDTTVFCQFIGSRLNGHPSSPYPLVTVDMGIPALDLDSGFHTDAENAVKNHIKGTFDRISTCHLQNNHIILFTEDFNSHDISKIGPALQKDPLADGINVHLARERPLTPSQKSQARSLLGEDISELYEIKIWERGAGLTQSCGSGACATAAAVFDEGFSEPDQWLGIDTPGGLLFIKRTESGSTIMAGPAQLTFTGQIEI